MTYKEITDLIKLINKSSLSEFKLKKDDMEIVIRTDSFSKAGVQNVSNGPSILPIATAAPVSAPAPVAPVSAAVPDLKPVAEAPAAEESNAGFLELKSPIVGTFYRSASPDKPPFKKIGDMVEVGETVCIVEAMKLFNEIESEISGKIVKVLIEDASPVEYDQPLFLIDPNG